MAKHPKRPRDPNQLAKLIVDISTGEALLVLSKNEGIFDLQGDWRAIEEIAILAD